MKKAGKIVSFALLGALTLSTAFGMTACGNDKNYQAIPYYDSTGESYNEALFRKNIGEISCADPAVFQITDPNHPDYGYFYLYGTIDSMACYKSKDLNYWESVSAKTLSDNVIESGCVYSDSWAPEIIYDNGTYYMFMSGTPNRKEGQTLSYDQKVGVATTKSSVQCMMYVLSSDSPSGPFDFVDHSEENRAESYTAPDGETVVDCTDAVGRNSFFDQAKYAKRVEELKDVAKRDLYEAYSLDGYFSNIDPYPFIDDDGTRYLYFVFRPHGSGTGKRYLAGVECEEGWIPKYDTITLLTYAGYMDVAGTTVCPYQSASHIDEGPVMLKHNGIYYLTYSFGATMDVYKVGQAVSTSPLGTFRKLDESENAVLLSHDDGKLDLTGPGGQTIAKVGDDLYIVYHRQAVRGGGTYGYERRACADKLEWVTIDCDKAGSKDGKMDVLYANGPTLNLQPAFEFASEYKNIADRAVVKAENMESGSSADVLNDGLIAMYQLENYTFNEKYVKEAYFDKTATITLTFDDYQTVRAIMIYNSKNIATSYQNVKRVEFDCLNEKGEEVTNYIANLKFDWKENRHMANAESYRHASSAIAEFDEIKCKEIRITIEIPQKGWVIEEDGTLTIPEYEYMTFTHEKKVGISEIVVLGK